MNDQATGSAGGWPSLDAGANRRAVVAGAALLAFAAAGAAVRPRPWQEAGSGAVLDEAPKQFPGWRMRPSSTDAVPQTLTSDEASDRTSSQSYVREDGAMVMLVMSHHAARRDATKLHRPEACYQAAGFGISQNVPRLLRIAPDIAVPGRLFLAVRGTRHEVVLYWIRIGKTFPQDRSAQRWATFLSGVRGEIPDGFLFRASLIGSDPRTAERTLEAFTRLMLEACGAPIRRMMLGGGSA